MIKFLMMIFFVVSSVHASEVLEAFKSKNYQKVTQLYKDRPTHSWTSKELIVISYSLRSQKMYSEDTEVGNRLIKMKFETEDNKLKKAIQDSESIDGEEYPKGLKVIYWSMFNSYSSLVQAQTSLGPELDKYKAGYDTYYKYLSDLEFRDDQANKVADKVNLHLKYLEDKIYHFRWGPSLQYVSWQQAGTLTKGAIDRSLIITNTGVSIGLDVGMENYRYHFYLDGGILYGTGNVQNSEGSIYQQSNVPAYGVKIGPGASVIVSKSRSRIGLKFPLLYSIQELTQPADQTIKVKDDPKLVVIPSLYSRWYFGNLYFQAEFGKYLGDDKSFWGVGTGYSF